MLGVSLVLLCIKAMMPYRLRTVAVGMSLVLQSGTKHAPHAVGPAAVDMLQEGEVEFVRSRRYILHANKDVPSRALADVDSKFLSCNGLDVHYKEAIPEVMPSSQLFNL